MEYEYDSWNRIQRMTYPDGEVVSYGYNRGGMLQRVTGQKNGQAYSYIDSLCYNKFELKEKVLYGNGTKTCYHYDILLRMDTLWSWNGTASHNPMQAIAYTYDGVGNITNIRNKTSAISSLGGPYQVHYDYDSLHRMTNAEGWHSDKIKPYTMQMGYYANGRIQHKYLSVWDEKHCRNCKVIYDNEYIYSIGNKLSRIEPIPVPILESLIPDPQAPTVTQINYDYGFVWDGAGNMISQTDNLHNTVRHLCWDAENRLQGVKDNDYLSMYQYDANGERTYKLTGSGYTQIINGVPTRHYALTNATLYASLYLVATVKGYTKHYYAESERIASRIGNGGLACVDTPIVSQSVCSSKLQGNSAYFDTVAQNRLNTPNYTTTHLLDTLYYWKTTHGNNEPDCYWYHPDHLGSASWVTDNNGEVVQYLYYLPWGEDFKNQRRNGYAGARHTFSAKEKDTETGLSYFGSRYYSSDLSIWLSVDPQSDKYPSFSPYVYCANNPIKLVDPNGEDWYEVENSETKQMEIKWTDYKSQADMDAAGVKGTYLGEAFVHFEGSKEEKVGEDGTLTGKGAVAAKVTIYGIRNKDDIKTYNGMTTPKSGDYSTLNEGDYHAKYQDMATSVYGEKGSKAKGIAPALTYRISSLNGTPLKGTKKGKDVTMTDVFLHRTDWNGKASNSSKGCPIIDGRSWRDVEKQLEHSSNIRIRITR